MALILTGCPPASRSTSDSAAVATTIASMLAAVTPRASSEARLMFLLQILQHFPELGLMNLIGDEAADNTNDDQHGG